MAARNGRGRTPQRPRRPNPKKRSAGMWALTAVATLVCTLLSLLMRIADRKLALSAVREDDRLSLLYFGEKKTEEM